LARGRRLVEILKQPQYAPYPVQNQVVMIWAATNGYLDVIPEGDVRRYEKEFMDYIAQKHGSLLKTIETKKAVDEETKLSLKKAVDEFKAIFRPSEKA
jgi:F-type H+-transporting ATPase subunit alpha